VIDTDHFVRFLRVDSVQCTERGLRAQLHGERLDVDIVRPDVVRLRISRGGSFDDPPTHAVCVDPLAEPVAFDVERDDDMVRVRTEALVVSVGLDPFGLDVHRPDGSPVVEGAPAEDGGSWAYAMLNDAFTLRRRCRPDDAFYGLGEKSGRFNRRGRDFTLWNTDVLDPNATGEFTAGRAADDPRADVRSVEFDPYYVSIPFFHHHAHENGAVGASFVDNGYRAHYDFTRPEEYRVHFAGGQYTEYVFAGPDIRDVVAAYTWLTGRTAPPPLWALAYHQCRWFRYTQESFEALAERHRAEDVPCDAVWLDIEHMDGYRVFTWDPEAFPDVEGMLARMADRGFRVVTIVDPGVKHEPGYEVFDEAVERDVLCRTEGGGLYLGEVWPGETAFPDFVTEEGRAWWAERNAAHVRRGLAGVWNDMNEPATGRMAPEAMRFGRGRFSHERHHNQYGLLMAMATKAGLLAEQPGRRPFVLTRAGFAGIQRYAANWMGDNQSRWDHLWLSVPMATGFGLSGQAFVGADVGGFQGHSNAELFLRWMQYGTLTPFCRNHSEIGNVDQYAWTWGDAITRLVREAIRLRYRLLPYLYAAFLQAAETGAPVQRPLVFDHQDDPVTRDLDDQYLLGADLLVAPVYAAGTTARHVYLPEGGWYDWHTGDAFAGPRYLIAETPMDRIPLYARAGAVVPMWPQAPPSTAGHHPRAIELHLFVPDREGTRRSFLQEDDGLTFAAEDGARYRTTFDVARRGARVTLSAQVEGAGYPEFAREAFHLVVHGATPAAVAVDGADVRASEGRFAIANTGRGFTATFDV
jgi:alpha-glucosidase